MKISERNKGSCAAATKSSNNDLKSRKNSTFCSGLEICKTIQN